MSATPDHAARIAAFITRWEVSSANELGNAQTFINELCGILEVEPPQVGTGDEARNAYVFNKTIPAPEGSKNFIDCYKRGHFVLETKQGADRDNSTPLSAEGEQRKRKLKTGHGLRDTIGYAKAMEKAHAQADRYIRSLPVEELAEGKRPPFIIIMDVGHSIALYAEWSLTGGHYAPFPDPATYRIPLKDLVRPEVRELLRAVWTDPLTLDPGRRSAKVTREIADRLAKLARSLEGKHPPEHVGNFLMRCLFTMFSEDVDLLPHGSFTALLGNLKKDPEHFAPAMESLWQSMNSGGYAAILQKKLPKFNGGLFAHADAIALNADQIQLLIEAGTANWKDVEPAIFGTLLERALDPRERHKLGAHYTPRAYVERLVNPTVIEPLREEWRSVQVAALQLADDGDEKKAIKLVEKFLYDLGNVKVLDPACGSGNFLYVTLELLKRLEGEVLNTLRDLGQMDKLEYDTHSISPANFYGIELNPRAAAIAEQVLWIGFLQWQLRTHGHLHSLPEPIIKDLHNIQNRDAVLEYDAKSEQRDANGEVVTRWDGHSTKPHPVTGEEVPDPEARVPVYTYSNPKPAKWPTADYIVGNPPFMGQTRMREVLGDGYVEALRGSYANVPDSADFVMYWWDRAAEVVRTADAKRFGFITTNSIRQTQNRKVIDYHLAQKKPIGIAYAIPDHPWVDSSQGAAVRIAMTLGVAGDRHGVLDKVQTERPPEGDDAASITFGRSTGKIFSDLSIGADISGAQALTSNLSVANMGMKLHGQGFVVVPAEAKLLGLGRIAGLERHIRPYYTARDIVQNPRGNLVIDLYGLAEAEVLSAFPEVYQWVLERVKPERDQNRDESRKANWWLFGRTHESLRTSLSGLGRFIITPRTAKHRIFLFAERDSRPESEVVVVALEDAYHLGVLSSRIHTEWSLATGGWMGVGNDPRYTHTRCFETFPFPDCTPAQQEKIRAFGEKLDAHRKRQQALHPELTMTGMYNVLEAVRAGTPLTAKDKKIYDQGLVGILKQLHDELDAAVAEAYGWPADLNTDEILTKLVALNAERAAEEARGQVRWLRPEYQQKGKEQPKGKQAKLEVEEDGAPAVAAALQPWPEELPAQAAALSAVLAGRTAPADVDTIASSFEGKRTKKRLEEVTRLLETLAALGRARLSGEGWMGV